MPVTVEPFTWASDLRERDVSALTAIFNATWAEWAGDRPMSDAAFVDLDRFTAPPERVVRHLARDSAGRVVGFGQVHWRDEAGACFMSVHVDANRRRSGTGRALAAALSDAAAAAGRIGVTVGPVDGTPLGPALLAGGFRLDQAQELNRTDVRAISAALLERWCVVGAAVPGYSLVTYDAPCPSDELAADFVHARHLMNDAPRFEGEPESTHTLEELRALEVASAAAHQDWWNVGVRHDASGEVVGLSDLYLPLARPWMAFQGDTGVHRLHRGHGLGAWMKAVNYRRVQAERPDLEAIQTWNAASNEPMLRINRALGFEPARRFMTWYRPFE